jgi:aquaporin Z
VSRAPGGPAAERRRTETALRAAAADGSLPGSDGLRAAALARHEVTPGRPPTAGQALRGHWPEYLIEAALLGLFMLAAGSLATLLESPASPLRQALSGGFARRALMGLGMGATAVALIYSPLGRRSGAHMNPAVTLTFYRLGKVAGWDALFYAVAQIAGGIGGVWLAARLLGARFSDPPVRYALTRPGGGGAALAFAAEVAISALLMATVLLVSNSRWARLTGLCAGLLVAAYITFEAPISGMSMNPARSFASALPAGAWEHLWIYFVAPPLGMLLAAALYAATRGRHTVRCAKLHHDPRHRCIFHCHHGPGSSLERSHA